MIFQTEFDRYVVKIGNRTQFFAAEQANTNSFCKRERSAKGAVSARRMRILRQPLLSAQNAPVRRQQPAHEAEREDAVEVQR